MPRQGSRKLGSVERETDFEGFVEETATRFGWKLHHETDSRKSRRGFPDLVLVGFHQVLWRELKTATGKVSPEQEEWLRVLQENGQDAKVWRPEDVAEVLADLSFGRAR